MASKLDKVLILSGFFGPIVFALVIFLSGLMFPGYDHMNQVISDLGAVDSPVKGFMNIFGFMLVGIFIMAFSIGVYKTRGKSLLGKIVAILFMLGGVAMFSVGAFPSDADTGQHPPVRTFTGEMHNIASIAPFVFLFPAFILLIIDTRNEKSMRYYFIVAGMLGGIAAIFLYMSFINDNFATGPPPLEGLQQRIKIGAPFLLMMYTAIKLYGLKSK